MNNNTAEESLELRKKIGAVHDKWSGHDRPCTHELDEIVQFTQSAIDKAVNESREGWIPNTGWRGVIQSKVIVMKAIAVLTGLTLGEAKVLADNNPNMQSKDKLFTQYDLDKATLAAERHGRANEHHVISNILTNDELKMLSAPTKQRLKARQSEFL